MHNPTGSPYKNRMQRDATMKISVIGTGYVGIISAVGLANLGHSVTCIDVDKEKIAKVNKGMPPIYEAGLQEQLQSALSSGKLVGKTDYASISDADLVLICVGTPSLEDGSMDMKFVRAAAAQVAKNLSGKFTVIAVRSTVVPGTTEQIVGGTIKSISGKITGEGFGLAMVPEFLKEGSALEDFNSPQRIIIGCNDEKTRALLEQLHSRLNCPKFFTGIKTAEMIKYASNSFLAAKISFANEIASMCEKMGIDIDDVMDGVGMDSRIGNKFLVAGCGFGGSCFPKDVKALMYAANVLGVRPILLNSVMEVNKKQQAKLVGMLASHMDVQGKTVALLGLAFKEGTDDVRESPALIAIERLLAAGAKVRAYDPAAMQNMGKIFPQIQYAQSWAECLKGADAALLISAWKEFYKPAQEYKKALGNAPFFDARRILDAHQAKKAGLQYYCIGRGEK